ncbi:hypothetical protein M3084_09545 [Succinatimonas hippei]|nr:hypothetical protein [Succinatimonas hippei]
MKYLTYSSPEEVVEMAKEDEVFAHVLEAEKMFVRNREEMLKYEAQEHYEMDLVYIKAESRIAKNLLKEGISEEQITQVTDLSGKELARSL